MRPRRIANRKPPSGGFFASASGTRQRMPSGESPTRWPDICTYAPRRLFPSVRSGEPMIHKFGIALASLTLGAAAFAQTKWDLPTAYPAANFHTENISQFASDVDKATGGKLKITVHANAALFKAPEIKRAVQGGQAQMGEILLVNYQ